MKPMLMSSLLAVIMLSGLASTAEAREVVTLTSQNPEEATKLNLEERHPAAFFELQTR